MGSVGLARSTLAKRFYRFVALKEVGKIINKKKKEIDNPDYDWIFEELKNKLEELENEKRA